MHPFVERAFNRAEAPVPVAHHEAEPDDPTATTREHEARKPRTNGAAEMESLLVAVYVVVTIVALSSTAGDHRSSERRACVAATTVRKVSLEPV